jgi:tetratricopeptide (TPR) repeat protein
MKLWRWISTRFSGLGNGRGPARSHEQIVTLVRESYTQLRAEEYDKARATLQQVLQRRDALAALGLLEYVLLALTATFVAKEDYAAAIAFFSEYVEHNPSDAAAYCCRGDVFWYSGELERALDDYSCALARDPQSLFALSGKGQVLAEAGRSLEAMTVLDLVLGSLEAPDPRWRSYSKSIEAFTRRGRGIAAAGLGETERAMAEFDSSIALCPENAWVYYSRAQVYERLGDSRNASADYLVALGKKVPALTRIQRETAQARMRNQLPES